MSAAPGSRASSSCWPTGSRSPRDTSRVPSGQVAASVTEQSLAVSSPEPCSRAAADWAASAEGGHSTSSSSPRLSQVHPVVTVSARSEEHTSELQSRGHLVCRLLLEKKHTTGLPLN